MTLAPDEEFLRAHFGCVGDLTPAIGWMRGREAIRLRRAAGEPPPWTDDPLLARYRFCNVRREDDRVTRWVRENVRERYAGHPNLWFMLCLCRLVNWPPTLRYLMDRGAWPEGGYDPAAVISALDDLARRGVKVWTGAYLLGRSPPGVGRARHLAGAVLAHTWARRAEIAAALPAGLEATHRALRATPGWGDFLAYQAVVDMRFTSLLAGAPDLRWAAAGPGTIRGLNRLHGRTVNYPLKQAQALIEMRAAFPYLRRAVPAIDFSDVPNICCETDKYLRAAEGGHLRATYRPTKWPVY